MVKTKQEQLIRKVGLIGNGAHIFVPKEWSDEEVIIIRQIKQDLSEEILNILKPYLKEIYGAYLVGSYARNEQTDESDIDVLAITDKTNKKICRGKYNLLLVSKSILENTLRKNILPLLPMIIEAKTIINSNLLNKYRSLKLDKENLKFHFETTNSVLNIIKSAIELCKIKGEKCPDSVAYSLILRLRETYIIDCLINKKIWTNKWLILLIRKLSGNDAAYKAYTRVKNNEKEHRGLETEGAEKLYLYIKDNIEKQEKWVKRKK